MICGNSCLAEICGDKIQHRGRVKRRGNRSGSPEEYGLQEYLVLISMVLCALFVSFLRG